MVIMEGDHTFEVTAYIKANSAETPVAVKMYFSKIEENWSFRFRAN